MEAIAVTWSQATDCWSGQESIELPESGRLPLDLSKEVRISIRMSTSFQRAVALQREFTMSVRTIPERDYFVTWVQFAICNAIGGAVAGALAGGLVGAMLGSPHTHPRLFLLATGGAGFVASLPVSYFFFRFFVSRLWFRSRFEQARIPPLPSSAA